MGAEMCYKKENQRIISEEFYPYPTTEKSSKSQINQLLESAEYASFICKQNKKFLKDYQIINKIGVGSFGVVYKVKKSDQNKIYAIKCVNKQKVLMSESKKSIEHLFNEIEIMQKLNSENLIKLYDIFQDQTNYYLVIDYCNQGDFLNFMKNKNISFLEEEEAVFYLNQIRRAFLELRNNNIMHRDIKMENLFVHDNILKLGDFGFAKINKDKTSSKLGSKYTMAPEIILNLQGSNLYDYKCDLWSIGCVFYEMLFGQRFLFENKDQEKTSSNVKEVISKIKNFDDGKIFLPKKISKNAEDLLKGLLIKEPEKRMDFWEFNNHPIFQKYTGVGYLNHSGFQLSQKNIEVIKPRGSEKTKIQILFFL